MTCHQKHGHISFGTLCTVHTYKSYSKTTTLTTGIILPKDTTQNLLGFSLALENWEFVAEVT